MSFLLRYRGAVIALLVFLFAAAVFRFTLTYVYSSDDLQYTILIETFAHEQLFYHPAGGREYVPQTAAPTVFHEDRKALVNPRYLLEWPTSLLAAKVWQALGWQGSVIVPIQALRALVGALGISLFFYSLQRYLCNIRIALLASFGFGFSTAYWTYSIHMDQSINMLFWLILAFALMLRMIRNGFTRKGKLLLVLLLVLASFYNFTALFSALAFMVATALFNAQKDWVARLRTVIGLGVLYAVLCVVGVVLAISLFVSPASLVSADFWKTALFTGKPEYQMNPVLDASRAAIGLAKSQMVYPGISANFQDYFAQVGGNQRVALVGFFIFIFVVLISPFLYALLQRKNLLNHRQVWLFTALWFSTHAVFNWFWDPGFNKYWLVPLLACWSAIALALDDLKHRSASNPTYYSAGALALAFVAFGAGINLTTQFLPQNSAEANPWIAVSQDLHTLTKPQDLFITTKHPLDFLVAYNTQRDIVSLGLVSYDQGGSTAGVLEALGTRIAQHRADGGEIYLYGFDILAPNDLADLQTWFASLPTEVIWEFAGLKIYRLLPTIP